MKIWGRNIKDAFSLQQKTNRNLEVFMLYKTPQKLELQTRLWLQMKRRGARLLRHLHQQAVHLFTSFLLLFYFCLWQRWRRRCSDFISALKTIFFCEWHICTSCSNRNDPVYMFLEGSELISQVTWLNEWMDEQLNGFASRLSPDMTVNSVLWLLFLWKLDHI